MWANGKGRSTKFSDWEKRRNEIRAQIENYEIGRKPGKPDNITASFVRDSNSTSGMLTINITVNGQSMTMKSLVLLPEGKGPFPAVIGMNSAKAAPQDTCSNEVVIPFTIEKAATYNFLTKCIGATADDDSYWIKIDNGTFETVNGIGGVDWQWGRIASLPLQPGQHTITISYREDGAKMDKTLITTSNASVITPEAAGSNCK